MFHRRFNGFILAVLLTAFIYIYKVFAAFGTKAYQSMEIFSLWPSMLIRLAGHSGRLSQARAAGLSWC